MKRLTRLTIISYNTAIDLKMKRIGLPCRAIN